MDIDSPSGARKFFLLVLALTITGWIYAGRLAFRVWSAEDNDKLTAWSIYIDTGVTVLVLIFSGLLILSLTMLFSKQFRMALRYSVLALLTFVFRLASGFVMVQQLHPIIL